MALDHAHEGIRVNCVCPGYMITPMTEGFRSEKHVLDAILESIPMHRGADPKEIGRAVLFLASDDASYITGQVLHPNGGNIVHAERGAFYHACFPVGGL